ncbi:MAG: DUF2059 domain-containing protein [Pirellulales bacterium]|nr:DUF2059 domain-containing protein [Pirellulales bacterium]
MRSPLRNALACVLLVTLSATFVWADEASHRAAADDLLAAMKVKENQIATAKQMLDAMVAQSPVLQAQKDILEEFLKECLAWDAVKDDFAKMYMEEFTESELEELAAFYRTPVGKKLADKTPVLAGKGAKIASARVQKKMPELQQKIRERLSAGRM